MSHTLISGSEKKKVKTYLKCGKIASQYFNRERLRTHSIESSGKLKISPEQHWDFTAEDLKDLGEIGRGAYGSVNKMVHKPSGQIMAVKVGDACHYFWFSNSSGAISWFSTTTVFFRFYFCGQYGRFKNCFSAFCESVFYRGSLVGGAFSTSLATGEQ